MSVPKRKKKIASDQVAVLFFEILQILIPEEN